MRTKEPTSQSGDVSGLTHTKGIEQCLPQDVKSSCARYMLCCYVITVVNSPSSCPRVWKVLCGVSCHLTSCPGAHPARKVGCRRRAGSTCGLGPVVSELPFLLCHQASLPSQSSSPTQWEGLHQGKGYGPSVKHLPVWVRSRVWLAPRPNPRQHCLLGFQAWAKARSMWVEAVLQRGRPISGHLPS